MDWMDCRGKNRQKDEVIGQTDEWGDGWTDGQMERWTDGQIY
jgi:hypothetical protein